MYLIVVANTLDSAIGTSSQKDFDKINELFTNMTDQLGITLLSKPIFGTGLSKPAVDSAVDHWLNPAPVDIVVFYYSGHGFRYSNDTSQYPRMSLRTNFNLKLDSNNLGLEAVYKRILKKKARVNIVMADCCNQDIGRPVPVGRDVLRGRDVGTAGLKLNFDNCKKLFFPDHPVSILTCAAEVKQLSVGNPALGGFFTNFFQVQLVKALYGNRGDPSWLRILLNARERTRMQALTAECSPNTRCIQTANVRKILPPF